MSNFYSLSNLVPICEIKIIMNFLKKNSMTNLTFWIFLFISALTRVNSHDIRENLFREALDCIEENHASIEELMNLRGLNVSREMLCSMKCLGERIGFINADGSVNIQSLEAIELPHYITPSIKEKFIVCVKRSRRVKSCEDARIYLKCAFPLFAVIQAGV